MPCIAVQGLVIPFKALQDIIYFADAKADKPGAAGGNRWLGPPNPKITDLVITLIRVVDTSPF